MIESFLGATPTLGGNNFLAPTSLVMGDVELGAWTSIWYGAVVRGDVNWIVIGDESNVQDNAVIHVTNRVAPTTIGSRVTIGHSAVVHGCTIEDDVLIGIGAVVLDHAHIGSGTIIGAGALVPPRKEIPPGSLVVGRPGRVVRRLTDEDLAKIREYATHYKEYSAIYLGIDQPDRNPYMSPKPAKEHEA